ncbi:MAG: phasin family protein [Phycisphaerae bacterium]
MFENLDKLMLAGLGAISMTREKAEKIFDEYVDRGQAEKQARAGFVKEVMDTADKTRKDIENLVSEQVEKTVDKLNLATKKDLQRLEEKIDKLLAGE